MELSFYSPESKFDILDEMDIKSFLEAVKKSTNADKLSLRFNVNKNGTHALVINVPNKGDSYINFSKRLTELHSDGVIKTWEDIGRVYHCKGSEGEFFMVGSGESANDRETWEF